MKMCRFWEFGDCSFGKSENYQWSQKPHLSRFLSHPKYESIFPKIQIGNITMSQGNVIYSVMGNFVYPLHPSKVCPLLHGDSIGGYS